MENPNEKSFLRLARRKIVSIGLIIGLLFVCSLSFLAYQYMEKTREQRLSYLKEAVQIARNTIEPILVEYRSQNISIETALKQTRDLVRRMVYKDQFGRNYIFMSAYDGIMLVQPFEVENEMTDMWDLKDANGIYIIRALTKVAKSKEGQGYVSYHYQRPGETSAQEKISFVIGIPELGCYIGTGQYMADINNNQLIYIVEMAGVTFVLLLLLFVMISASMKEIGTQNVMLRKAERELTAIFDNTFQFIATLSPDGRLVKVNRSALSLIGKKESDVIGRPFWETPWWTSDEIKSRLKTAINDCSKGEFSRFEVIHKTKTNELIYVDFSLSPISDDEGHIISLLAEGRDVSEQTKVRNELTKEKTFFNHLIESLPGSFFLYKKVGDQYLMKQWNRKLHEQFFGYPSAELLNAPITKFVADKDLPALNSAISRLLEYGHISVQIDTLTKDKKIIPFLYQATYIEYAGDSFIVGTGIEITEKIKAEEEKKKLEAMLAQSQKIDSLGTLAGGIAHDFNNILSAVLGYAELVLAKLPPEDASRKMQSQVISAAIRAKNLVNQILLFSRQSELEMKPVQLEMIVKEALKLLRSTIPSIIEIKQNVSSDSGTVLADSTQIHQIVMNLCTNAYHAMKIEGGILEVSLTEQSVSKEEFIHSEFGLHPGTYLRLEVSDTGHGIDSVTLGKIFDPYFTTKEKGEGTGLGLSVVHGIVKNCGGDIKVYSELGRGTKFQVFFPKVDEDSTDNFEQTVAAIQRGSERLLLIDDDQMILEMTKQSLNSLGYTVAAYSSSQEALEAFRADPAGFDLVITDMTMPKMTGMDLGKKIMSIRPQTPIVLCTGYSDLITREKAQAIGIKAFLYKPVLREALAKTIREVLDKKQV